MAQIYNLNVNCTQPVLSPNELQQELPATRGQLSFIERSRQQIKQVLDGQDSRLLLIVGPCSIHNITAAKEYANKLRVLSGQISDTFMIVMRVYLEKPRTNMGWKGLLYDPNLDGSYDIETGLKVSRQLLLDLADLEVPVATEFLDPSIPYYLGDLISWGCIGARTTSSQIHRQMASGLSMPIAFKNNTDGNVSAAIHGVMAAAEPHTFLGPNESGRIGISYTKGNPHCHVVLRGGEAAPNYHESAIHEALKQLEQLGLPSRLIVDCSHDNSNKKHEQQPHVFRAVLEQYLAGNHRIRGMILESNLLSGSQDHSTTPEELHPSVSLTDPCLDWATTEYLIQWAYAKINPAKVSTCQDLREEVPATSLQR